MENAHRLLAGGRKKRMTRLLMTCLLQDAQQASHRPTVTL